MSIVKILIPKKNSTALITAKVERRITIPISAEEIRPLADSSAALSPPEEIQAMAPQMSISKKITAPIIKSSPIKLGRKRFKKLLGFDGSTDSA